MSGLRLSFWSAFSFDNFNSAPLPAMSNFYTQYDAWQKLDAEQVFSFQEASIAGA